MLKQMIENIQEYLETQRIEMIAKENRYRELQEMFDKIVENGDDYVGTSADDEAFELDSELAELEEVLYAGRQAVEMLRNAQKANDAGEMRILIGTLSQLDFLM